MLECTVYATRLPSSSVLQCGLGPCEAVFCCRQSFLFLPAPPMNHTQCIAASEAMLLRLCNHYTGWTPHKLNDP